MELRNVGVFFMVLNFPGIGDLVRVERQLSVEPYVSLWLSVVVVGGTDEVSRKRNLVSLVKVRRDCDE